MSSINMKIILNAKFMKRTIIHLQYFLILFLFVYLKGREGERETKIPSMASLPKCPIQSRRARLELGTQSPVQVSHADGSGRRP